MRVFSIGPREVLRRGIIAAILSGAALARGATLAISPPTVSNTYAGAITLQIGGLTNGETVVIDKYLDANTNGLISAGDWLVRSFRLTDGRFSVIGGATNINIPGDANPTNGAITAPLNFQSGGVEEHFVGKYFYRLSSPTARFTAVTNSLTVTAAAYPQWFTGKVQCSGTNVPYAGILAFAASSDSGGPVAEVLADASGGYSVKVPPGTYQLLPFRSNYVCDASGAPLLTLAANSPVTNNLLLIQATRSISGRFVDATNASIGFPGILAIAQSTNGLLGLGFSDTNGTFAVPATASRWKVSADADQLPGIGYLSRQSATDVDTSTGSVSGVIIGYQKGTALFHGAVTDDRSRPMSGIVIGYNDAGNLYEGKGTSDSNGSYAVAAVAGGCYVGPDRFDAAFANYVPPREFYGTIGDGEAVLHDFVFILATNHITGWVRDLSQTPVANVRVYASTALNGDDYQTRSVRTDTNGIFSLTVGNAMWDVRVDSSDLAARGYLDVDSQNASISNANAVANFTVLAAGSQISGHVLDTDGHPITNVSVSGHAEIGGSHYFVNDWTDSSGYYSLKVANGSWDVSVDSNELMARGYLRTNSRHGIVVSNSNPTVDFAVLAATNRITGHVRDTDDHPVTNLLVEAQSQIGGVSYYVEGRTDDSGYYSLSVANGSWDVWADSSDLSSRGYLPMQFQSGIIVSNNSPELNLSVHPAPFRITGHVRDTDGHAISNVTVAAQGDIAGTWYYVDSRTDGGGYFSLSVANGSWDVWANSYDLSEQGFLPVQSQSGILVSNDNPEVNFAALPAPFQVTGFLRADGGAPIPNVYVYAYAHIDDTDYTVDGRTDGSGHYSMNVANGTWTVAVSSGDLMSRGFQPVIPQSLSISNDNGAADFTALPAGALQVLSTSLSDAVQDSYYFEPLWATGGQTPYEWSLPDGTNSLPPGSMGLDSGGYLSGIPTAAGSYKFLVCVSDSAVPPNVATQLVSMNVILSQELKVTTDSLPDGAVGADYAAQLEASGGTPPYTWSLDWWSPSLPADLSLSTNGLISGVPAASGYIEVSVSVTDADMMTASRTLSLTIKPALPEVRSVTRNAGIIRVTWSATEGNAYQLQCNSNLLSTNWIDVAGGAVTAASPTAAAQDVPGSALQRFYRVKTQEL